MFLLYPCRRLLKLVRSVCFNRCIRRVDTKGSSVEKSDNIV